MQPVTIRGVVTRFKGNGRKLGYPTANLNTQTDLKDGVYFGFADMADYVDRPAMIFVGIPTTIGDSERRVEAYLFDIPDKDYYGEQLTITLGYYHRPNQTFAGVDELMNAIKQDEVVARQWFTKKSSSDSTQT